MEEILDKYGLPTAGLVALGIALTKLVKFVKDLLLKGIEDNHAKEVQQTNLLMEEIQEQKEIIIKLVDNSKAVQSDIKDLKGSLEMVLKLK